MYAYFVPDSHLIGRKSVRNVNAQVDVCKIAVLPQLERGNKIMCFSY